MPAEWGVPKGLPQQQVPQSVQKCAVKKDAARQIGEPAVCPSLSESLKEPRDGGTLAHIF